MCLKHARFLKGGEGNRYAPQADGRTRFHDPYLMYGCCGEVNPGLAYGCGKAAPKNATASFPQRDENDTM